MRTKAAIAILLVSIFALSSIATIAILPVKALTTTLTLSDAELMLPEFTWEYDPGSSLTGKTDTPGPGVQFDLAGLGKAGVGDNFPLNPLAGGTGPHNSDFTGYSKYSMLFVNLGSNPVSVALFMNTGFTNPPQDGTYDTFWTSSWTNVGAHQTVIVTLDFSSCGEVWNAWDDPVPEWRHPDGSGGWPVRRLDQVSNIGFQVLGSGSASILASGTLTKLYIDPPVVNKTPSDVCVTDFTVNVTLSNFARLMGFDLKLTWDSTLITFVSVDKTTLDTLWLGGWTTIFEQPGAGSYELTAISLATSASNTGASILFKVTLHVARSSNFPLQTPIHFAVVKLSDDGTPVPNPIPALVTDGMYYMSNAIPDLEFKILKYNKKMHTWDPVTLPDHFEYCNLFEVEVYVTDIHDSSPLEDYDVTINFNPGLAVFKDVDAWGIFGTGSFTNTTDAIHVWGNGSPWHGVEGLLFTLTFHVEFTCIPEHIWKYGNPNFATFQIWIEDATLSFGSQGTIPISGITVPSPLTFEVDFIRGDVNCDGTVTMADISSVAYYYGQPASVRPEYDLNNDGIIDVYDLVTIATNYGYGLDP